ncbi:MAG TPA: carboxypeptidase-like regulatory domain-containing protein, partial [Candidatus Poseidoniaceae archaeon]
AGSTSMKLSGYESIWTDSSGAYEFSNIPEGEYSIRAYFMDNGHTVAYRKVLLDADLELDW